DKLHARCDGITDIGNSAARASDLLADEPGDDPIFRKVSESFIKGGPIVPLTLIAQQLAITLNGAVAHLEIVDIARKCELEGKLLMQPARKLGAELHHLGIVELSVGQRIDALGYQRMKLNYPAGLRVIVNALARNSAQDWKVGAARKSLHFPIALGAQVDHAAGKNHEALHELLIGTAMPAAP